jgi:PAS domain S-box-containing protein
MPAAVYSCDVSGLITYCNERAIELWGRAPQIGDTDERFCGSEQMILPDGTPLPHEQCPMAVALREGRSFRNAEVNIRRPDGSQITVLVNIDPIRNEDGTVVGAINAFHDVSAIKRAEQAARESEARLRLSQQVAKIGTFDWNVQTGANTWSPELEKLYGLEPGQFAKTQSAFEKLVHPDDLVGLRNHVERSLETGAPTEAEWRAICPDGSIRWLAGHWQAFNDEAGKPLRVVGVHIDVTERKRAETTQQLLLNELNHRVKNTLASVQAIAQQTLSHTRNPTEFVASFAGRLRSLARVHAMLSSTTWQGADLRELIRDQLLSGPVDESRLNVWGPSLHLEAHAALHLGMVLHELGTNSCKYGALSVPSGKVTVSWTTDDALHIQWVERGGPPVKTPSKRGFGVTLVEQSATAQGGDAKMLCQREGVTWTINLPLRDRGESDRASPDPQACRSQAEDRGADANSRLSLAGRRFLVVEDEPLIGLDIVAGLEDAGAQVEGPVGTVEKAIEFVERAALDGALLDANLRGRPVDEIASALTRRGVPFVFVTGYGSESLPQAFRGVAVIAKPFSRQQVFDAAVQLVAKRSDVVRLRR